MIESTPYKKLYRSRCDRIISGLCAGLGEHFGIDPTWVRLLFILFALLGGFAVILYLIMWIIVPLKPCCDDRDQ